MRGLRYTKAEKREMWILPGMRPLAEPPALNPWIKYIEKTERREMHIEPCIDLEEPERDKEYARLFPDDPERGMYLEDLRMEETAMLEYYNWSRANQLQDEMDKSRSNFYHHLAEEVIQDCLNVAYDEQAYWVHQAVLVEEKRLKDIEKAKKAAEEAKRRAELRQMKELKLEEERKIVEKKVEEARRFAATWMGRVNRAWASADQIVRNRY